MPREAVMPPDERSGPGGVTSSPQSRSNATATTTVTTDRVALDADIVAQARRLVEEIGDQAERDRRSYEAGWNDCVRLLFDHALSLGREQVLCEIEAEQAEVNRELSRRALDAVDTPRAELDERRYPGYGADRLRKLRERGAA
jgi:hypothetical protein